jgi:hypothetical protein
MGKPIIQQRSGDVMDVSGVSSSNVQQAQGSTKSQADILVQKKAMEIQEQAASELIEAVPDNDSSVGQNIDVTA